jgi:hypothetical protein
VVSCKKISTVMSPIRRRMKKRNPSGGQNGQLVHWWLLFHSGPCMPFSNRFWSFLPSTLLGFFRAGTGGHLLVPLRVLPVPLACKVTRQVVNVIVMWINRGEYWLCSGTQPCGNQLPSHGTASRARVNKHLWMHHHGWIVHGQDNFFSFGSCPPTLTSP